MSDEGLRYAAERRPPEQRDITLSLDPAYTRGTAGGVVGRPQRGDDLAAVPGDGRERSSATARCASPRSASSSPSRRPYETHVSLRYQDGLTDVTQLVAGRWPVDRGVPSSRYPLGQVGDGTGARAGRPRGGRLDGDRVTEIGVKVGDRLGVTLDGSDPLVVRAPFKITPTEIEIVGLFEPIDRDAAYWDGDTNLLQVVAGGHRG